MAVPVKRLYNSILSLLQNAGIDEAEFETEVLLMWATQKNRTDIYTTNYIDKASVRKLKEAIRERLKRKPVQYLTERVFFYNIPLKCSKGVFIPRQETETVVETALKLLKDISDPLVLDLCAGTGAIGLAIACNKPDATVHFADHNPEAIELAKENAISLGLADRVAFFTSDLFKDIPMIRYHLIVSNPPYIPSHEIPALQPEIKLFEPRDALDGGKDGLEFYRLIMKDAAPFLLPQGYLVFELGTGQKDRVIELSRRYGFSHCFTSKDLLGIPRALVLRIK